jgi:hypothetical protein
MTDQRVRRLTATRLSTARALRVGLPVALLVALAGVPAGGQGSPTISIGDVTVVEGNSGIAMASFPVTLTNPNGMESRVSFSTADGTAVGGVTPRPFPAAGPFPIPDGTGTPATITFDVAGIAEPVVGVSLLFQQVGHPAPADLDFLLVAPDGRTMIVQSDAIGIPLNGTVSYGLKDGQPPLPANGVPGFNAPTSYDPADVFGAPAPPGPHPQAAPAGTATLNGTFGAGPPSSIGVGSAHRPMLNGFWKLYVQDDTAGNQGSIGTVTLILETAEQGTDYAPTFGTLRFPPGGPLTRNVNVPFYGDSTFELDETFTVDLSSEVNAVISKSLGIGTIRNDDGGGGGTLPLAVDDAYTFPSSVETVGVHRGVLANDNSNGGGPLTVELVTGPTNGTLKLRPDGSFDFKFTRDSDGNIVSLIDSFTYRARNSSGLSNVATVTIVLSPRPAPTNLRVTNIRANATTGLNSVTLRFDTSPSATNHAIDGGVVSGQTLATVPTNSPSGITTLDNVPNGSFFLRVRAIVGNESSGDSNEIPLHNTTAVAPSAPENLLIGVDGSNVNLTWNNTYLGGIPTNTFLRVTGDADVMVPLGPTETFSYAGVPAGTYNFTVFTGNASGLSATSNAVTATFPGTCTPPEMPADFLAYVEGVILGAAWELPDNGPAPNGYLLHVTSPLFTGTVPVAQRSISGQVPAGIYSLRVAATGPCGDSPFTPSRNVEVLQQ